MFLCGSRSCTWISLFVWCSVLGWSCAQSRDHRQLRTHGRRLSRQSNRANTLSSPFAASDHRDIGNIIRDQGFPTSLTARRVPQDGRSVQHITDSPDYWDGQRFRLPSEVFQSPNSFVRPPSSLSSTLREQRVPEPDPPSSFVNPVGSRFSTSEARPSAPAEPESSRDNFRDVSGFSRDISSQRPEPPTAPVSAPSSLSDSRRRVALQPATLPPKSQRISLPRVEVDNFKQSPVSQFSTPVPNEIPERDAFSSFRNFREAVQIRNHGASGSGGALVPETAAPPSFASPSTANPLLTTPRAVIDTRRIPSPPPRDFENSVRDNTNIRSRRPNAISTPDRSNRVQLDPYPLNFTDDPFYYDYDELYDYFYGNGGLDLEGNDVSPSTPSSRLRTSAFIATQRPLRFSTTTTTATTTTPSPGVPARLPITRGRLDAFTTFEKEVHEKQLSRSRTRGRHRGQSFATPDDEQPSEPITRGRNPTHSFQPVSESPTTSPSRRPSRPTLKPASKIVSKKRRSQPLNIWTSIPSRPAPLYPTPKVNLKAARCDDTICLLPDCYCGGGRKNPGGFRAEETPQIVLLTFDDAVNDLNKKLYEDLFEKGRANPNGCPIQATFYVSHEWTDYSQVQNLYADGHEIASHTISHSFGEPFSEERWANEVDGMREILAAYAAVKREDIRGMRAPFLQIGGNKMFKMLYDYNFTYDSSMPVYNNNPPSFPYTLDYKIHHDCMIDPCPTHSFPGVWEVPMVMWQDLKGGRCSMVDGCSSPDDAEGVYKMLIKNFERHYTSNRAPLGLFFHAAWFTQEHRKEGFIAFLDTITSMDDVWMVTNWQAVQWMRDPTPLSHVKNFKPFECHYPDRPPRCPSGKNACKANHKSGARFMKTCQACPDVYPWTGKTGVARA